ncbi:unnamed protein product [Cunninghamella blakesleeana]
MEKVKHIQTSDSAIASNLVIENHSVIQVESESNQNRNNDLTSFQSTISEKNEKNETIAKIMTFIALQVALFLSALDSTIVSTILPHIGSEFNQMTIVSWVATAYILTFDAFQPMFAKFSDIFGHKWTLITAIIIFLIGSLLCGISTTMIMLIISRALSGVGAAGIFSGVFIVISEIVPLEKRGNYQGAINAVFAFAGIGGPLGGFTDNITWRWCFYINLPIGGAAIILLFFFLDLPTQKSSLIAKLKRIDYLGTLIILIAALLFLLALNFGSDLYPWTSAAVLVPLIVSFILIILFIIVESKFAKEPIVPLRLFKNKSAVVVKGDSAMWSGIRLLPLQLAVFIFSFSGGLLISKLQSYRPFLFLGTCLITLGVGLVCLYDVNTSFPIIYGTTVIEGAGFGLIFASKMIAMQASVEPKDTPVAVGLVNFFRFLGSAVGVAIASSILNSELKHRLPTVLPSDYVDIVIQQALYVHHGLPDQYKEATIQVYCDSIRLVWYVITPLTGLSILGCFLLQHYDLRKPGQHDKNHHPH